ncbi:hypothetical protein Afil01_58590 [Actinorhabdospora filicis]|uniref:Uncharacterized protein n=1 Tax=Actinorhabdospora filicis TaxID=1785913 RepID=A0A9W6W624_9ACTN|nr:hypothetical protein [Actinorhabdospora filicis]GLZ81052.1 hypothetical protein Afil01_58590 [Actinorhabdospora filicis]
MPYTSQVTRGARRVVPGRARSWLFRLGLGLLAVGGAVGFGWSLDGSSAQAAGVGDEPTAVGLAPASASLMGDVGHVVGASMDDSLLKGSVLKGHRHTAVALMANLGRTVEGTAGDASAEMEPVAGEVVGTLVCGDGCTSDTGRPRDAAPASHGDPLGTIAKGVVRTSSTLVDDVTRTTVTPALASLSDSGEATAATPGLAHRVTAVLFPVLGAVADTVTEPGSSGPAADTAVGRPLDAGAVVACLPRPAADLHPADAAAHAAGDHAAAHVDAPHFAVVPVPAGESLPAAPCAPLPCSDSGCAPGAGSGRMTAYGNGGAAAVLAGAEPSFFALPGIRPAGEAFSSPTGAVLGHIIAPD